jgi:hypothetical protein
MGPLAAMHPRAILARNLKRLHPIRGQAALDLTCVSDIEIRSLCRLRRYTGGRLEFGL